MTLGPSADTPAVDPTWTDRQKQVLDLLAANKTNPEIADELGIGIDGAKAHVRVIFEKLGVDSRDEAAAYWRARNRPTAKVRGWARGLLTLTALKWVGGTIGALALGGAIAGGLYLTWPNDDDSDPAVAPTTETATAPTPNTTATPATPPDIPDEIAGLPVETLTTMDEIPLPPDMAITFIQPFREGALGVAHRIYRPLGSTAWVAEVLLPDTAAATPGNPSGTLMGLVGAPDASHLLATLCFGEPCGAVGPIEGVVTSVRESIDGGLTWQQIDDDRGQLVALRLLPGHRRRTAARTD